MEKEIVITKKFRAAVLQVYQYLLKKFSAKTAFDFLTKIEKRIDFISKHPEAGKTSVKKENIRSILFTPHNRIFYRLSKNKIEILSLFDMRKNPSKNPY